MHDPTAPTAARPLGIIPEVERLGLELTIRKAELALLRNQLHQAVGTRRIVVVDGDGEVRVSTPVDMERTYLTVTGPGPQGGRGADTGARRRGPHCWLLGHTCRARGRVHRVGRRLPSLARIVPFTGPDRATDVGVEISYRVTLTGPETAETTESDGIDDLVVPSDEPTWLPAVRSAATDGESSTSTTLIYRPGTASLETLVSSPKGPKTPLARLIVRTLSRQIEIAYWRMPTALKKV